MKFDLAYVREHQYKMTKQDFAKYIGIGAVYYEKYEEAGEIPSKYIYKLWCRLPNFPIPSDFFYYTSQTLLMNMKFHNKKQIDMMKQFGFETQATVSNYLRDNLPMYEKKKNFQKAFKPMIVPFELTEEEPGKIRFYPLTDLTPKGNMMEEYSKMARRRGKRKAEANRKKKVQKNQKNNHN